MSADVPPRESDPVASPAVTAEQARAQGAESAEATARANADSAEATARANADSTALQLIVPVGSYARPAGVGSTASMTAGRLFQTPIWLPGGMTFDLMAIAVTSAGPTGSTARLGIRAPTSDGRPGTLLFDLGSVPTDAVAQPSIAAPNSGAWTPARGLYWLDVLSISSGTPIGWGVQTVGLARSDLLGHAGGYFQDGLAALPTNSSGAPGISTPITAGLRRSA